MSQKSEYPSIKKLFVGGLAAGALSLAVSLLLRLVAGGLFVPEIASQTLFSLTPGQFESLVVGTRPNR